MHVVKTHWVAHTILRCQAIIVLISLQLCLITSLEANLHSEKEPSFTKGIHTTALQHSEMETSQKKSERNTSDSFFTRLFVLCCAKDYFIHLQLNECLSHTVYTYFPFAFWDYESLKTAATLNSFQWYVSKCWQNAYCFIAAWMFLLTSNSQWATVCVFF